MAALTRAYFHIELRALRQDLCSQILPTQPTSPARTRGPHSELNSKQNSKQNSWTHILTKLSTFSQILAVPTRPIRFKRAENLLLVKIDLGPISQLPLLDDNLESEADSTRLKTKQFSTGE